MTRTTRDKIIDLLHTTRAATLRSITNLSQARETGSRVMAKMVKNNELKKSKRKVYKEQVVLRATDKLVRESMNGYERAEDLDKVATKELKKALPCSEIASHFIRDGAEVYKGGEVNDTANLFVPHRLQSEFVTGESDYSMDFNQRLTAGLYITDEMLFTLLYIPQDATTFYYRSGSRDVYSFGIRKLPKESSTILYLMSNTKHKDMLRRLIKNEEARGKELTKFYNFFTQKNDTYLIPEKCNGAYEMTKVATTPSLNQEIKQDMSNRIKKLEKRGFSEVEDYFITENRCYIYMPVIKVALIREIVKKLKKLNSETINIGLITYEENIPLLLDYITNELEDKRTVLSVINSLNHTRERKEKGHDKTYILEKGEIIETTG